MTRKPVRKRGRHVLLIVSLMLLGSAAVRFGAGPGAAIARDLAADPAAGTASEDDGRDLTPEFLALLADLKLREERLEDAEADLAARMEVLARVEDEVRRDLERLTAAEEALRATIAVADGAAANDIARLTTVYENMKPEQASALFQKMEPSFAAGFLGEMRPDAAAQILAGLDADLAYSISVVLAGRNANVPTGERPE